MVEWEEEEGQEANMVPDVIPALKQKGQADIKNAKKETVEGAA